MNSTYRINRITDRRQWESLLREAKPQTFLHSWQWGDFNEKNGTPIIRYGIYHNDTLIGLALIVEVRARRGIFLLSPHGPVIPDKNHREGALIELLEELTCEGVRRGAVCIRLCPLYPDDTTHNNIFKSLAMRPAPVHLVHPELSWVLDLNLSEDELLKQMRKSTRYSIRKAEKEGVRIIQSNNPADLDRFYEVYKTTVARQQFTPFSKEYLQAEFETFAKDNRASFFFSEFQGATTSAAIILFDEHGGYYHHGATAQQYPHRTDAQLLQWEIIKECKRRGCQTYNFWGVVSEGERRHAWWGLSVFKRGFGGREERYLHAQDLVLSPKYWITYIIERIRRIQRGL